MLRWKNIVELSSAAAFRFPPVEFDDACAILAAKEMRQRPYCSVRMIGTAAVAGAGKGAELILELVEAADVMNLPLRVTHRNRLGPHGLASACSHETHRNIAIGGLYRRAHHLAAEIAFRDNAVGSIFMKGDHGAPAPNHGRFATRAIVKNVGIAVAAFRGDYDADFICAKIIASRRPRRIDCDDHCGALVYGDVLVGAAVGFNHAIGPERSVDLIDINALIESLALLFRKIGEACQEIGRKIR